MLALMSVLYMVTSGAIPTALAVSTSRSAESTRGGRCETYAFITVEMAATSAWPPPCREGDTRAVRAVWAQRGRRVAASQWRCDYSMIAA